MSDNRLQAFFTDPLRGKTSLSRVFWLYGVAGSLIYGAIEFFINPDDVWLMRAYILGALLVSVYVTLATYQCARNARSPWVAKLVRVSAVLTLLLLPVATYLELTGAVSLSSLEELQLPE